MNIRTFFALAAALAIVVPTGPIRAQAIGVGAGLAIPSAEIGALPESVRNDGWDDIESRAERGYFIEVRGRLGSETSLTGAVSYNRFLDATSDFSDGSGRTVSLITSQAIVPASLGLELTLGEGVVSPWATVEGTISYFYRSFESPYESTPVPFRIESSGETRYGAAVGAGTSLDLVVLRFDAFARAQFVNLFGGAAAGEPTMYFLQLGLSGYFGL
jgi:hypothetical protein